MTRLRFPVGHVCIIPALYLVYPLAHAQAQFTPRIELNEQYIENKTATTDESGNVTRISPGFLYTANSSRSSISIDYSLDAITSSGLSQEDEVNHNLNMRDSFTHIPGRWVTELTGNVSQTNISNDGVQLLNPNLTSDNTTELRTLGLNTDYNGRLTESIRFNTRLGADHASYKDAESTQGYDGYFSLDNARAHHPFSWLFDINSSVSETDTADQQIDTAHLNLDYRFNQRFSTFFDVTGTDTDNDQLNETETLLGLNWTPGRNTSLRIAVGKRGDEDSYSLDASHQNRRMTLTANYEETVSSARVITLSSLSTNPALSGTTQSISITPVLEKRSTLSMLLTGRRSSLTLTLYQTDRDQRDSTQAERTTGARLRFSRELSARSSFDLNLLSQNSKTTQTNDLSDVEMGYNKDLSGTSSFRITARKTRQDSSESTNDYQQTVLGMLFTKSF